MPRVTPGELASLMYDEDPLPEKQERHASRLRSGREDVPFRPRMRRNERETFKCGHCRAFIGPAVSGGRHRNHCPLCLTSRHVDLRRPGDRLSPCRSLMAAIGVAYRADGEQMVVHRCNGCGIERQNRIAADDDMVALLRLPPVIPVKRVAVSVEEAMA